MADRPASRDRRFPRLRAVPPVLLSSGEPFEGFHLLVEMPNEAGVILWQLLRDVTLWATAPRVSRTGLFTGEERLRGRILGAVEISESIRPYLLIAAGAVCDPPSVPRSELVTACRQVSDWAEEQDLPRTAIAFAQAASLAWPESAECAYKVGWLCRRNGEYGRAEAWFRRSIALSRRRRDTQSRAMAMIGLGKLHVLRGDFQAAEALFKRALRAAARAGLAGPKAKALHDLFALAVETGRVDEAESFARKTTRAFGSTHPRLPVLAHDIAGFWLSLNRFSRALVVFQAVLPLIRRPSDRLQVLARICRAAGGAGNRDQFTDAWTNAWRLIDSHVGMECIAAAQLNLAYGSVLLADWERAELAAGEAVSVARARQQVQIRDEAETILRAVYEQRLPWTPDPRPLDPAAKREAEVFACALVRKLGVYAGVVHTSPRIPCRRLGSTVGSDREDPAPAGR